jgi:hypothetical protein
MNTKPKLEWTAEDFEREYGSVTLADGTVCLRCMAVERIAAAGLLDLEDGDALNRVPVIAEVP